jgi:hypothetical protein
MNPKLVEDIANAVLYEGYMLYPYRASAVKNKQRWNFGVLYPCAYAESQQGADAWSMRTECLAVSRGDDVTLNVRVRFLHLVARTDGGQAWQEAVEREVTVASLKFSQIDLGSVRHAFAFSASSETDGPIVRQQEPIEGAIETEAERAGDGLFKIRVRVLNTASQESSHRDQALMRSLVSAHVILNLQGGEFVSLLEPPNELRDIAATCQNVGVWPVLVGEAGERDTMLASPIILYDYPRIAPESAGALFDGTEIDEILTLRIMTLTDEEKREVSQGDERARRILERTESMPMEQLVKMHGAMRGLREVRTP